MATSTIAAPLPHVRYILRVRPVLRTFCADGNYGADIRRAWAAYGRADATRKLDLLHHSIGYNVAGERRCYSDVTKDDPEKCLEVILLEFGEKGSTAELLVMQSLPAEATPRGGCPEVLHPVNDAGERLRSRQRALKEPELCPTLVREPFIIVLQDDILSAFLKDQVFKNREMTAIRWSEDSGRSTTKAPAVRYSY